MSAYTKEQIARADSMDLESYVLGRGIAEKKGTNRYRLKGNDSMYINGNHWFWYYANRGGRAISFLTDYEGIPFVEAMKALIGEEGKEHAKMPVPIDAPKHRESAVLQLPDPNENNNALFRYLSGRGISRKIVQDLVQRGVIYQSNKRFEKDENGNPVQKDGPAQVIFLGRDPPGEPRYACSRCIAGDGKFDLPGSDKAYSFALPAKAESRTVWVFESAIDLLSHATLCSYGTNPVPVHRVSLGGVSPKALEQYLSDHPNILFVNLALDADAPGRTATKQITEMLEGKRKVYDHPPRFGKDCNDDLLAIQQEYRTKHLPEKEAR